MVEQIEVIAVKTEGNVTSQRRVPFGQFVQSGTIQFNGVKTITVDYITPYNQIPSISAEPDDSGVASPKKVSTTKTTLMIQFQVPYTGAVHWQTIGS